MQLSDTISFLEFTYCKAESLEQFRFQEETNRARRLGMPYYVAYMDETNNVAMMMEHHISEKTNAKWLEKAIELGAIYMKKPDFEITKLAVENSNNVKA